MNAPLSSERPVGPGENFALLVGATVTTALFYVYVMAGMLALLAILLVECGLLLAALRIPMLGRLVLPLLQRHGGLLAVFFRSLWPQKGMEMRVPMEEGDSPRLFAMLKRVCEKAEVPMPREVVLEMGVNAWVNMKGWRAGTGKTTLGIGYDLIAGLTEGEVEGVLGHEMMHAKLVQRGFRQLITCGVGHSVRLARGLAGYAAPLRKGKREDVMVEGLLRVADVLARRATRQMAACSRQDEFAADRGAAELCGAGALRSSLMKIGGLQRIAARLPLRERVAHLESTEGFGLWLAKELAAADHGAVMEPEEVFNEYSTHPSPHDRLAALAGYPDEEEMSEAPAIEMLTRPDEIAEKLVGVIQKELVANEERDNKALGRWGRRIGASRKMQFLDLLGWGVLLTAAFCCIVGTLTGNATEIIVSTLAVGGGGMMIWGRPYREKMPMPMPGYAEIRAAGERRLGIDAEMVKRMEEEMRAGEAKKRTAREKAEGHLAESREALSQCDYVRAHVAARLCLQQMRKSIPGHLALAVAAAGIKNAEQARMAVLYVNRDFPDGLLFMGSKGSMG
jgi:Zn-dependent protease with chaperone function